MESVSIRAGNSEKKKCNIHKRNSRCDKPIETGDHLFLKLKVSCPD